MRIFQTISAVALLAAPLAAQTALNEQFNYSTTSLFPPTGWSEVNNNSGPNLGWEDTSVQIVSLNTIGVDSAGHDDYLPGATNDFSLVTPAVDLSAYATPELVFDESIGFTSYMAHHPSANSDGINTVEMSTDGGVTWTTEWTETAIVDGLYTGIVVDLASYAGQSSVEGQFHYYGTYAQAWVVDNVVIDNGGTPVGPALTITGTCPGPGSIDCAGMTAGGLVYVGYTPAGGGSWIIPVGGCAGATVNVAAQPTLLFAVAADGAGNISLPGVMPPTACGVITMVAFDVSTCTSSNAVSL